MSIKCCSKALIKAVFLEWIWKGLYRIGHICFATHMYRCPRPCYTVSFISNTDPDMLNCVGILTTFVLHWNRFYIRLTISSVHEEPTLFKSHETNGRLMFREVPKRSGNSEPIFCDFKLSKIRQQVVSEISEKTTWAPSQYIDRLSQVWDSHV